MENGPKCLDTVMKSLTFAAKSIKSMKMKTNVKRKTVICMMLVLCAGGVKAHDFVSNVNGQTLYFAVTDTLAKTAEVTYQGAAVNATAEKAYQGILEIPVSVKVKGRTYRITGIGDKAFSNATHLEGIIIPSGLTRIGHFAFEGCTSLRKVVFPGNTVEFGDGVFFRCEAIETVTLGSDWQSIDLNRFRWSKRMEELYVPAKMRVIRNMKSLKTLKRIEVDGNNPYYKSQSGMLYSHDGLTLLGVPRAYADDVVVAEGTEIITRGALADCLDVKNVELPASVTTLWFGEFARLTQLEAIAFHASEPLATATTQGAKVTALCTANEKVAIYVPRAGEKNWKKAIVKADGEYAALETSAQTQAQAVPMKVSAFAMAGPKNIKGVKNVGLENDRR